MEGPNIRRYPRTYFSCPIELCAGGKTLHLKRALGNLSIHGLFVHGEKLPIGEPVHVTIACSPPFDIDGNVRFSDAEGVGIEFIDLNDAHRKRVDELIAEFLPREVLAGRKGQ